MGAPRPECISIGANNTMTAGCDNFKTSSLTIGMQLVLTFVIVSITSLYNGGLKNENFVVNIYRCFTVKAVKISKATW
jgi:hypothetical protein